MFSDKLTKAIAEAAKTVMGKTNETWPDAASTSIYADKPGNAPISDTEAGMDREMTDEEVTDEEISEALKKSQPASEWITDFVNSKDAKFKGKSKAERINMALGAYYAAQRNESVSEGVEEPRAQGEKNFKAAHTIVKMHDVNQDDQTGTEAMDKDAKPTLPMGKGAKKEDVDGEKYIEKDVADIKASAKSATAPKANGPSKANFLDDGDVVDKTISTIRGSSKSAEAPKATGSKQSNAQSAEKVTNSAPNGKLSAEYPKANQKHADAQPKGLKETALAALLGEDALEECMSNFDKQYADDNAKALKQIISGQGTEGIDSRLLPQLNKFVTSYGDEVKKHLGLPIVDGEKKDVKEATEMSDEDRDDKVQAIFKRFGIADTNYEQDLDKAIDDLSKKSRIAAAQVKSLLKDSVNEVIDSASDRDDTGEYKGGSMASDKIENSVVVALTDLQEVLDRCLGNVPRTASYANPRISMMIQKIHQNLADVSEKLENEE